jgi:hypothetical protein
MKAAKLFGLLLQAGLLAVLPAGCFNPIIVVPPETAENPLTAPFSVDILIGKAGDQALAHSVAGPDILRLKGNIHNFVQLVVVNTDGKIVAYDEARRKNIGEKTATFKIEDIDFGATYSFLLLMGHWDRKPAGKANGDYDYEDRAPTLLAAGLNTQPVTGNGKVAITMWPVVVETVFTSSDGGTIGPAVKDGKPEPVVLLPTADWSVTWTVQRGVGESGLADLVAAQKKMPDNKAGDVLRFKRLETLLKKGGVIDRRSAALGPGGNVITRSGVVSPGGGGGTGSVNFNLEYAPFGLIAEGGTSPWEGYYGGKTVFNLDGNKPEPVWIIRNGVNDDVQTGKTNFINFMQSGSDANGNGAVVFIKPWAMGGEVSYVPGTAPGSYDEVHIFRADNTVPSGGQAKYSLVKYDETYPATAEVLVVAGGGGGGGITPNGGWNAGGGGAGGYIYVPPYTIAAGPIPVKVGAGGARAKTEDRRPSYDTKNSYIGNKGGNSEFGGIKAFGGGGGASHAGYRYNDGQSGGSGGGGTV